mmetsp:Transcript_15911/g.23454  ORF Transcript_15911/g.23454 Transcript_15911/m.23454 type:complete len:87 (-) Transcript_15911:39-299(-)
MATPPDKTDTKNRTENSPGSAGGCRVKWNTNSNWLPPLMLLSYHGQQTVCSNFDQWIIQMDCRPPPDSDEASFGWFGKSSKWGESF